MRSGSHSHLNVTFINFLKFRYMLISYRNNERKDLRNRDRDEPHP
jgi:hypothetical protein